MHRVVHFELGAQEPERAAKFYQQVFGWQIPEMGRTAGILAGHDGSQF
jgi:predicted enzyme related to lactoylglutathione lyase